LGSRTTRLGVVNQGVTAFRIIATTCRFVFMPYGLWFMVYGLWFMVYGL